MNIHISFLPNKKTKTPSVVGELGLSQKCSTTVKMILAGIHIFSDVSVIYLTHPYLKAHEYPFLNNNKKAAKRVCTLRCINGSTTSRLRDLMMSLYLTLTRPHLQCCIQFQAPQYKEDIDKLQQIQMVTGWEHLAV